MKGSTRLRLGLKVTSRRDGAEDAGDDLYTGQVKANAHSPTVGQVKINAYSPNVGL